jgi:predicted extracellular nuclease
MLIGTDAITVCLLYRPNKVSLVGETIMLDSANSPVDEDGQEFIWLVNYLKSKGSSYGEVNEGDNGQANCNIMRTRAAQGLTQFLATYPTGIKTDKATETALSQLRMRIDYLIMILSLLL